MMGGSRLPPTATFPSKRRLRRIVLSCSLTIQEDAEDRGPEFGQTGRPDTVAVKSAHPPKDANVPETPSSVSAGQLTLLHTSVCLLWVNGCEQPTKREKMKIKPELK